MTLKTTVAVLCFVALGQWGVIGEEERAPNLLFILADDLGYEMLGSYGGMEVETPALDKLASEGMRFSRAYTSPVCTPSRMSFYTGTSVSRHGYYGVLPVHLGTKEAVDFGKWKTSAQVLRSAGYATSVTGKWQLAALEFHPEHCRSAGYDSWCVWQIWRDGAKTTRYWNPCFNHDGKIREDIAEKYGPDVLADYVIGQMRAATGAGTPFFIHHNMLLPHWPILETPVEKAGGEKGSLKGMVRYMDMLVGKIVDEVDELGIGGRTYVIFMGDNGTDSKTGRKTESGAVTGGKTELNDGGTHVPLLVRGPGVAKGSVAEDLVDMTDLFPTLCALAGVAVPDGVKLDGVSFAGRLRGGEGSGREFVSGGYGGKMSYFDGEWRMEGEGGKMVDARELPVEKAVGEDDDEAEAARARILEKVRAVSE